MLMSGGGPAPGDGPEAEDEDEGRPADVPARKKRYISKYADVELARKLADARNNAGLTQGDVGRRLGLPQNTVSNHETGKSKVRPDTLKEYANLYGVTMDWFVSHIRTKPSPKAKPASPPAPPTPLPDQAKDVESANIEKKDIEDTVAGGSAPDVAPDREGMHMRWLTDDQISLLTIAEELGGARAVIRRLIGGGKS